MECYDIINKLKKFVVKCSWREIIYGKENVLRIKVKVGMAGKLIGISFYLNFKLAISAYHLICNLCK